MRAGPLEGGCDTGGVGAAGHGRQEQDGVPLADRGVEGLEVADVGVVEKTLMKRWS